MLSSSFFVLCTLPLILVVLRDSALLCVMLAVFFLLQGTGGVSIYGGSFEDESFSCKHLLDFHS